MLVDNHKEYSIINSADLFEGLHIDCEVYYKFNNEYVVALRNCTLTKIFLLKLQKLEITYGDLYIENTFYEEIYSRLNKYKNANKVLEFNTKYSEIKLGTNDMLNYAIKNKTIDNEASTKVSISIKDKIVTIDASDILQVINSVREDDQYLLSHSTNVAFLNGLMGKWLKLPVKDIQRLIKIGLLHDIGKTMIPDAIMNKPAKLTPEEFELVKTHPVHSFDMLIKSGETDIDVLLAVRGHHEKTNGTGYPDKLTFERITLFARITTISDIYDAMISKRVYKDLHSPFEVLEEFSTGRFSNLDTHLINIFLSNMPKELLGKSFLLSDGSVGKIMFINANNYAYPIVKVGEKVFTTTADLKCISTCEDI